MEPDSIDLRWSRVIVDLPRFDSEFCSQNENWRRYALDICRSEHGTTHISEEFDRLSEGIGSQKTGFFSLHSVVFIGGYYDLDFTVVEITLPK